MKAMARFIGQLWIAFGVALLLLLLLEQLVRAVLPVNARAQFGAGTMPDRERAAAVAADAWTGDYWREHEAARHTRWRSYVYWRRQPFDGDLIDVDAHGFRVTPRVADAAHTIWLFGGSTAWGTGNRQIGTLAAALQMTLSERGIRAQVLNFAESGYVSHQSLQAFQLALRCGAEPSLAVFVDGANDVFAAYQRGVAGTPQNESTRELEFLSSRQASRLLVAIGARFQGIARLVQPAPVEFDATKLEQLADAIASQYLSTVDQARAIAGAIPTVHRWQPTAFDLAVPKADETDIVNASERDHVLLQRAATSRLLRRAPDIAVPLAPPGPVFFDFVHLSERGQQALAASMADEIAQKLANAPAVRVARCENVPVMESDAR